MEITDKKFNNIQQTAENAYKQLVSIFCPYLKKEVHFNSKGIAVLNDIRVRIIVKKEEKGMPYFWSIIPFWKMDIMSEKRLLHNGNPMED